MELARIQCNFFSLVSWLVLQSIHIWMCDKMMYCVLFAQEISRKFNSKLIEVFTSMSLSYFGVFELNRVDFGPERNGKNKPNWNLWFNLTALNVQFDQSCFECVAIKRTENESSEHTVNLVFHFGQNNLLHRNWWNEADVIGIESTDKYNNR